MLRNILSNKTVFKWLTIAISALAALAIAFGGYLLYRASHTVELKNPPSYTAVINVLNKGGLVKEDLRLRGLIKLSSGNQTADVKFGEIQKLVDAKFYVINSDDELEFGPNYVPSPTQTTISYGNVSRALTVVNANRDNILQVWSNNGTDWVGNAIPFGDGTTALTVVNYMSYTTDSKFLAKWPGHGQYHASIQAIDPATSLTLLKLEGVKIPPAAIGDSDAMKPGDNMTICSWNPVPTEANALAKIPELILAKTTCRFPGYGQRFSTGAPFMAVDVISNEQGQVIGLTGTLYHPFYLSSEPPNLIVPIINLKQAMQQLADKANQSWDNTPVYFLESKEIYGAPGKEFNNREDWTKIRQDVVPLLTTLGDPVSAQELPKYYMDIIMGPPGQLDGTYLSILFLTTATITNESGVPVAEAKWVGIQFGRGNNKPNQLIFGTLKDGTAVVQSGFILKGDLSALEKAMGLGS
jgi:hypothetical protein